MSIDAPLPDFEPSAGDSSLARALLVDRYGPRCAAWLVGAPWHHRGAMRWKLHKHGQVDIVVPDVDRKGAPYAMQMWFSLAVELLKKRKGWSVEVIRHRGERRFRIKWLGWRLNVAASARLP